MENISWTMNLIFMEITISILLKFMHSEYCHTWKLYPKNIYFSFAKLWSTTYIVWEVVYCVDNDWVTPINITIILAVSRSFARDKLKHIKTILT